MTNASPILVATDLSARSDRAVDRAVLIAAHQGAQLKVVHVPGAKDTRSAAEQDLAVRDVLPDPGADADVLLPTGSAPQAIVDAAAQTGSALIIAGVARRNELRDHVLGTAVDHIIRHAGVPVLVVKQRPHRPYRNLLVLTDFSETSRHALLAATARFPGTELHLLNVCNVPIADRIGISEYMRRQILLAAESHMRDFLAQTAMPQGCKAQTIVAFGEIDQVLKTVLAQHRPDLVVMGTHGESALEHVLLGSTAESLLSWLEPDTLVVPRLR